MLPNKVKTSLTPSLYSTPSCIFLLVTFLYVCLLPASYSYLPYSIPYAIDCFAIRGHIIIITIISGFLL